MSFVQLLSMVVLGVDVLYGCTYLISMHDVCACGGASELLSRDIHSLMHPSLQRLAHCLPAILKLDRLFSPKTALQSSLYEDHLRHPTGTHSFLHFH
jgi:hypothetical protein